MAYRMHFVRLIEVDPEAVPESDWDAGLSDGKLRLYRPVMGVPSIVLRSDNLENAKTEAADHWRSFPRGENVEGYLIVDEAGTHLFIFDQAANDAKLANARSN
jgi:hypothetical protein